MSLRVAAGLLSRRLRQAAVVPRVRVLRRFCSSKPPTNLNANESFLFNRILENDAAIGKLSKDYIEVLRQNVKLTAAVAKADAAAREATINSKSEMSKTAWKVVIWGITGFVSTMYLISLIVESPVFEANRSKVKVVLTDEQAKRLVEILGEATGPAQVVSSDDCNNPFVDDQCFNIVPAPATSSSSGGPVRAPATSSSSGGPVRAPATSSSSGGPDRAPATSSSSGDPDRGSTN